MSWPAAACSQHGGHPTFCQVGLTAGFVSYVLWQIIHQHDCPLLLALCAAKHLFSLPCRLAVLFKAGWLFLITTSFLLQEMPLL